MTGQICIVASPKRAQFQGGRTIVIIGLLQPSAFAVAMGISLLLQQLHAFAVTGGVTLLQGFFSLKSLFFFRLISKADLYYYPTFSCKSCRCLYAYRRPKKNEVRKSSKFRKYLNSKIRKIFKLFWQNSKMGRLKKQPGSSRIMGMPNRKVSRLSYSQVQR